MAEGALPPPLVLLGIGGHTRVVAEAAALLGYRIAGHLTPQDGQGSGGGPWLGNDDQIGALARSGHVFALAFGFVDAKGAARRAAVLTLLTDAGAKMPVIRHPAAVISPAARLAPGVFVAAGAVVGPGVDIGAGAIINTGALVEHDCRLGRNTHAATGCRLAGGVQVGDDVLLGLGCAVRQGVRIGAGAIIGAGAVVLGDVPPGACMVGVPARAIRQADGA